MAPAIPTILRLLEKAHGVRRRRKRGRESPLDALVRTILSQNTTDANRDRGFASLKAAFPTYEAVAGASHRALARAIAPAGLMEGKARAIQSVLAYARERFGRYALDGLRDMDTGAVVEDLLPIKGVGIKTVYVLLCMTLDRDVFPMDTHCLRLLKRLGHLPPKTTLERGHRLMADRIPRGKAYGLHLNLIRHGKAVCRARKPDCPACVLRRVCPSSTTG